MSTAGFGGHDADDEGRADEELPLGGAAGMVVSVAGALDRANRLQSRQTPWFGEEGRGKRCKA